MKPRRPNALDRSLPMSMDALLRLKPDAVPVEDFRMGARSVSEDSGYSRRPDFATWRRSSRPIGWPGEPSSRWRTAGPDLQQAFPNRIGFRPGRSITVGRGET